MTSFTRETKVAKTRKPHRCYGCLKDIEVGSPALSLAAVIEGEFCAAYYHTECRAAEIDMNHAAGISGEEWCVLYDVRDLDLEEWLIDEHPIAAGRLGLVSSEAAA